MDYKQLIIFCIAFFLYSLEGKAQKNSLPLKEITCDCIDAIKLTINQTTTYGLTQAPEGCGRVQEFTTLDKYNILAFEKEHNSAWYLLSINYSGEFIFEIEPKDTTNDYDFLLYEYKDSSFCENLLNKRNAPIRSNISRSDIKNKGMTGLSKDSKNEFQGQGPGYSHSKSIQVKKGEKYMLVLDNVSKEPKGHWIYFNYLKPIEINGIVIDSDSLPTTASITLLDNKGEIVEESKTNNDGKYEIKTKLKENTWYSLVFMNDTSFVATSTINTINLKNSNVFPNIKIVLPKLKKGNKYPVANINFYGGLTKLLPESYPSLQSLYLLLKKNRKMIIQIEGHVNAADKMGKLNANKDSQVFQELSLARANTVYDYLKKKGISAERMTTIGLGATKMIFPFAKNDKEESANRRVEINVISINGD